MQRSVVDYLRWAAPDDLWWTSVNPVPAKSKAVAGMSKALGMRAGVPDFIFLYRGQALLIELKSSKGRESPAQREMSLLAAKAAVPTFICRSVDEVAAKIAAWGVPLKGKVA